jgi:hypothetical protein
MTKNVYWSARKVPVILVRFEVEFSGQVFQKYSDIKFHENPSIVRRVFPCVQTDVHDGARPALFLIFVLLYVFFVLFYVFFFCVILCIVCVYMCTVLLPSGGYPIAVDYIIYHIMCL